MRSYLSWATIVASLCVVSSAASPAQAQQQSAGANASRYGIGVVDISYIFKNHQRFKAQMEQMKVNVQRAEATLKAERDQITNLERKLKQLNPGTPDYTKLDEQVDREKQDFNLKANRKRKDFLQDEAKIYYKAYLEVNDAVKQYASTHKLGLVLRFNGDPIDPNRREDVLRAINKPVVFQNGIDITPDVLRIVNRSPVSDSRGRTGPVIPGNR